MKEIPLAHIFHQYTKKFYKKIPKDSTLWPEEWKTIYYKSYPRAKKIKLIDNFKEFNLFEAIKKRETQREFTQKPISLEELSLLLKYSCGLQENGKRAIPSGGGRYPIETYCLILQPGSGLEKGIFHYDVKNHQLEFLFNPGIDKEEFKKYFFYEFAQDSSLIIFLTGVFWRTLNKYGQRGYRFILQEAGHIGQNIYLLTTALGLKCCALAGTNDDEIEKKLLDIDGFEESLVYTLLIGK